MKINNKVDSIVEISNSTGLLMDIRVDSLLIMIQDSKCLVKKRILLQLKI